MLEDSPEKENKFPQQVEQIRIDMPVGELEGNIFLCP
jgi:hypothetical protein